jgi:hypothetical protein
MSNQPKFNSRGQFIEELYDDIKPVLLKRDNSYKFNNNLVSINGKRKFNDAFDNKTFDDSRYGKHISSDFFKENIASGYEERKESENKSKTFSYEEEQEILNWCEYYRANRSLFKV